MFGKRILMAKAGAEGSRKRTVKEREKYIMSLVNQMTLDEKIGMIHGAGLFRTAAVPRLGIPELHMSDGPMGVRQEFVDNDWKNVYDSDDTVTYLPSNSAIAATWNPKRAKECGEVLGTEARGRGKDVILAPGINIKRTPLCGRNFEYMSEDPYLVSEMTVPLIKGIQKADVAACVKHFAVNGQETNRLWVDTIVDKRTLYELYLPGFDAAVNRAHSYSIMGAYNMLNGQHCCESRYLLGDILRKEWGYDGTVISDWGGVHDTVAAAESELDLEMSITFNFDDYCMANPLKKAVEDGKVKEKHIDKKVANLLRLMYRLKMLPGTGERKKGRFHSFEHIKAARKTAEESVILLKNDKTLLPLKLDSQVAVIGRNATAIHSNGGGSAEIKAIYEVTPLRALMNAGGGDTRFVYEPGYVLPDKDDAQDESWQETSLENAGSRKEESADETLMARIDEYRQRAVKLARENRQTIIFAGLNHDYDIEGRDKSTLKLPYHQDELIEAVLDANPDTIVVIMGGAPVEMPWLEKAKAVVWYYYSGLEGAMAVADVLTGKVNPSGKLPETFPKHTEDIYSVRLGEFGKEDRLEYKDGVFVGYRYYVSNKVDTNFCFGHGLSYTDFSLKHVKVEGEKAVHDSHKDKWDKNDRIVVSAELANTGKMTGMETVQLYVTPPKGSVERPVMELKGFEKVKLAPGEKKHVRFELDKKAFSYYDESKSAFTYEHGEYIISLGMSVEDIRQTVMINL